MEQQPQRRIKVFVSYSHKDKKWLERLQVHLKPLERDGVIDLWVDTKLQGGDRWREEIQKALDAARVAILLVSADFLASDFIHNSELPPLLRAAQSDGAIILPLIVGPCRFVQNKELSSFQAVNDPSRPLVAVKTVEREVILVKLTGQIEGILRDTEEGNRTREYAENGVNSAETVEDATALIVASKGVLDYQVDIEDAQARISEASSKWSDICEDWTSQLATHKASIERAAYSPRPAQARQQAAITFANSFSKFSVDMHELNNEFQEAIQNLQAASEALWKMYKSTRNKKGISQLREMLSGFSSLLPQTEELTALAGQMDDSTRTVSSHLHSASLKAGSEFRRLAGIVKSGCQFAERLISEIDVWLSEV